MKHAENKQQIIMAWGLIAFDLTYISELGGQTVKQRQCKSITI